MSVTMPWYHAGKKYVFAHKILSVLAAIVVVGGGWWAYRTVTSTGGETRYVLGTVEKRTIIASISASGQVSASRQLDVKPEVSGTITYVAVKAGQTLQKGALIAQIDPTAAQKALRDAQNNLETAKLSLEKLQKPVSGLSLTQAQNAVTSAQDSLAKTYDDSENDIVDAFLGLPDIMTSLQDIVIGTTASRGTQWNIDYYQNAADTYDDKARAYRDDAYDAYKSAKAAYDTAFVAYKTMGNSPDITAVEKLATQTYEMLKSVSAALKNVNSLIQFYKDVVTTHGQTVSATATAALTDLASSIGTVNGHLSTLSSDTASIKTGKQDIIEKTEALADLIAPPDELDVRSEQLTIQQREDAVTDAQDSLAKYYVRAPFGGTITKVSAYAGDDAGSAALVTMITPQQIAALSLNEVDAAKIKIGNKATLTFDAIEDLTLTGSVVQIDAVGTISQGVVSYEVQIAFDTQNDQIKTGMTVNASIQTAVRQDVLTVPSSAVKTQNGVSVVQVFIPALAETGGTSGVASNIAPQPTEVTIGISDDTNIEIRSGLTEGQQIVTRTTSGSATTNTSANGNTFGGPGGLRL